MPTKFKSRRQGCTLAPIFRLAQMRFERRISLHGRRIRIRETVESLCAFDRPIGWTQHVTLGPPFLQKGQQLGFARPATRSKVFETKFGVADYLKAGAEFRLAASSAGRSGNRIETPTSPCSMARPTSSAYTAHLMDPTKEHAFSLHSRRRTSSQSRTSGSELNFPWMGIWEENHSRTHSPWNGQTLARGMEFGMSPMPESRREMMERGRLFGTRTFGWLPANRSTRGGILDAHDGHRHNP